MRWSFFVVAYFGRTYSLEFKPPEMKRKNQATVMRPQQH
jgi:hypothetical protein